MKYQILVLLICNTLTLQNKAMDELAEEMFEKLKKEHGIDSPEGEEELRSVIMNSNREDEREQEMSESGEQEGHQESISHGTTRFFSSDTMGKNVGSEENQDSVSNGATRFFSSDDIGSEKENQNIFSNAAGFFSSDNMGENLGSEGHHHSFSSGGFMGGGGFGFFSPDMVEQPEPGKDNDVKDESEYSQCEKTGVSRENYEHDMAQLKSEIKQMRKVLGTCVPRDQYQRDITHLMQARGANQHTESHKGDDMSHWNMQLASMQDSLNGVLRKIRGQDKVMADLTTSVSALEHNYARNTVQKCQSGQFSGCECSKCCGQNAWNCDGTKEIFYPEAFHTQPALTISVGTRRKTKDIDHPVIFYEVGKESFKLQYLATDHFIDPQEVQVNWMACA